MPVDRVPCNQTPPLLFTLPLRGASGAGKTTFLNVLAGHAANKGNVSVTGSVTINGEERYGEKMRQISGYVHQVSARVSPPHCSPLDGTSATLLYPAAP